MEVGNKFFFREGTTRGIGSVIEVLSLEDDPDKDPAMPIKQHKKRRIRPNNRTIKVVDGKKKIEVL